mgnify:CR=1 FL=1
MALQASSKVIFCSFANCRTLSPLLASIFCISLSCNHRLFESILIAVAVLLVSNPTVEPTPARVKLVQLLATLLADSLPIPCSVNRLAIFSSRSLIRGAAAATPPPTNALSTVPPPNAPIAVCIATR